jgi:multiple sugar transport system substrate-binding protein
MGCSKNQGGEGLHSLDPSKRRVSKWFNSQQGYSVGATTIWEKDPLWQIDPVMAPFRVAARAGQFPGFAGPADRKAAEVLSKYIITDMYAKAVQGMPAEDAVKWAHEEVVKARA